MLPVAIWGRTARRPGKIIALKQERMRTMRTYDMTPLFRSTVGFDRLFDELFDNVSKLEGSSYPPYNIEVTGENAYRITLAIAGFGDDDLDIELTGQTLRIAGQRKDEVNDTQFLHQGIAGRSFERRFQLADNVKVTGADLRNGLLSISLEREIPEALKPRKIEIGRGSNVIDGAKRLLKGKSDAA
jgi:molecular chaperone IbpA